MPDHGSLCSVFVFAINFPHLDRLLALWSTTRAEPPNQNVVEVITSCPTHMEWISILHININIYWHRWLKSRLWLSTNIRVDILHIFLLLCDPTMRFRMGPYITPRVPRLCRRRTTRFIYLFSILLPTCPTCPAPTPTTSTFGSEFAYTRRN
ncbi:hypothetical protein EDD16DRAFT_1226878 [Pisolithus croceorrhizus]|nr:hypothetical protein EDD16DRAFT_1226878 [Pisolithus croceorrhizus]